MPLLLSPEPLANAEHDFSLAARVCPEDTVAFLHSQLGSGSEAARVVSLDLLRALVRPTGQCREAQRGRPGVWAARLGADTTASDAQTPETSCKARVPQPSCCAAAGPGM